MSIAVTLDPKCFYSRCGLTSEQTEELNRLRLLLVGLTANKLKRDKTIQQLRDFYINLGQIKITNGEAISPERAFSSDMESVQANAKKHNPTLQSRLIVPAKPVAPADYRFKLPSSPCREKVRANTRPNYRALAF